MQRLVLRSDTDGKGYRGSHGAPTIKDLRMSETAKFARGYDRHMETTGHYAAQKRLIDRLYEKGAVKPKFCDIGCGTGEMLGYLLRTVFSAEIGARVNSHLQGDLVDPVVLTGIDENTTMLALAISNITATLTAEAAGLSMEFAKNKVLIEVEIGSTEFVLYAKVSGEERTRAAIAIVRLLEGDLTDLQHSKRRITNYASASDTFLISYVMHWLDATERTKGLAEIREMLMRGSDRGLISAEECPLRPPPKDILVSSSLPRTKIQNLERLYAYFESAGLKRVEELAFSKVINDELVRVGGRDYPHELFVNVFVPK